VNEAMLRRRGVGTVLGVEFEAELVQLAQAVADGTVRSRDNAPQGPRAVHLPKLQFRVPDRAGLPALDRYATLRWPDGSTKIAGYTEASRGCKHRCRHCPVVPVYDGRFRVVDPDGRVVSLGDGTKLSYDLLRMARRDGILVLERHVNEPHTSEVINKYPRLAGDHHAMEFLCGGLAPVVEGATPEQTAALLEAELKVLEEEHHAPITILTKAGDALPGFGIVAAVLGIVITMGAIAGPVEEVGHKVGSALVGTFLGILPSYGFFGPLTTRMEFLGHSEAVFFRTMASIIIAFANGNPPKVAVEQARRGVNTENRPKRAELDELFKEADAA
jgi:chemotaxis protein MotA